MKRILSVLCAVLLLASLAVTSASAIANPWADCNTMVEAKRIARFPMTAPEQVDGYRQSGIQAMKSGVIQVFYEGQDGSRLILRKGKRTQYPTDQSLHGDYNEYNTYREYTFRGEPVRTRGNTISLSLRYKNPGIYRISNASWDRGLYKYTLTVTESGIFTDTLETFVLQTR